MIRITHSLCLCAIACLFSTGCFNRYQNPYGSNACIAPPGTGSYVGQNPNPYYQYQTPQPGVYGQPYGGAQTWQASAANYNGANVVPVIESGTEVAPAAYEAEMVVPVQPQPPGKIQIEPQTNFDESGYRENSQGNLQPQYTNQSGDSTARVPQSVLVPLSGQQAYVPNVAAAPSVAQQPIYYVPVDPGAVVASQNYQPQFGPAYQAPVYQQPVYQPAAYQRAMQFGPTAGTNVAFGSTVPNHNPQWQGVR